MSRRDAEFNKLKREFTAKRKELETAELESVRLYESIKELQEQIRYKDGQIDALKYAVNVLAGCAYWPELPKYESPAR